MTVDELIVISNFALVVVTLIASFLTMADIHKEDQKTIRAILFGKVSLPLKRKGKGRHED